MGGAKKFSTAKAAKLPHAVKKIFGAFGATYSIITKEVIINYGRGVPIFMGVTKILDPRMEGS